MSTIGKTLGLLEFFSSTTPEIGLSEFARVTGFDKGTLHRHLTSLRDFGFVEQNPSTKAYRLGPAVLRLAAVREKTVPLLKIVQTYIDRLASDIQELVHISVPQANGASALYSRDGGQNGTRVWFEEAEILPYHATSSGLVLLTFGPEELQAQNLKAKFKAFTSNTLVAREKILAQIEDTKARGYARAYGTFENDVHSVAVPFFDTNACAKGSIAVATPSARMTAENQRLFTTKLMQTSQKLSQNLGGQIPPHLSNIWTQFLQGNKPELVQNSAE